MPPPPDPFKLLEITIISAQDLAPVSRHLRTYAVAWVHPDQKLTTRVDHHGHTNPIWNYRFVFRVDEAFLTSSSSSITIEIFNVTWLRDLPIGSVCVFINSLFHPSPSSQKMQNVRDSSLMIRRPSGSLQGILNLGVNVVDGTRRSLPLDSLITAATSPGNAINDMIYEENNRLGIKQSNEDLEDELEGDEMTNWKQKKTKFANLWRSRSEKTVSKSINELESASKNGSLFSNRFWKVNGSIASSSYHMKPLPSEVAASMAKGLYWTPKVETGSSIFDNWTEIGENKEEVTLPNSKYVRWKTGVISRKTDQKTPRSRGPDGGGGLLSCFGILCGYECNIICGVPKGKKRGKKRGAWPRQSLC